MEELSNYVTEGTPEIRKLVELRQKWRSGEIDLTQFNAGVNIFKKLTTIYGLKVKALELAHKKDKTEISRIIMQDVLRGHPEIEAILEHPRLFFRTPKEHIDLWKPFFEIHGEAQVQEWFQYPKLAKPALALKIRELKGNLKQLKEILGESKSTGSSGRGRIPERKEANK